jgi:hypothetical protein
MIQDLKQKEALLFDKNVRKTELLQFGEKDAMAENERRSIMTIASN